MATKNSRQNRGNYTAINPTAKARLDAARLLLKTQHRGEPLTGQFDLEAIFYYSNKRSLPDIDNAAQFLLDSLKGVVTVDDSPRYIRDLTARTRISRYQQDLIEITLREVEG